MAVLCVCGIGVCGVLCVCVVSMFLVCGVLCVSVVIVCVLCAHEVCMCIDMFVQKIVLVICLIHVLKST